MAVLDALLGAIVGSLLTGILWAGRYLLIEHREKRRLERMLHTELSHMGTFDRLNEFPAGKIPYPSAFPTIIFESNTDKIGILQQEHRHSIHAFYSYLEMTKSMINQEIESEENDEENRRMILYNLDSLRKRRNTLLEVLEE